MMFSSLQVRKPPSNHCFSCLFPVSKELHPFRSETRPHAREYIERFNFLNRLWGECPNFGTGRATGERFLPTWATFTAGLGSRSDWLQSMPIRTVLWWHAPVNVGGLITAMNLKAKTTVHYIELGQCEWDKEISHTNSHKPWGGKSIGTPPATNEQGWTKPNVFFTGDALDLQF